jgi:DNA topoisomerase-1
MNLVIVESPAKCSKIQGFLGAGWKVIATMGHIRALKQELAAVGIDNGWKAQYEWLKEKSKAIQQLKEAAATAKDIYLAADADREGSGIAYATAVLLRLNPKTAKRITFTEITQTAIRHAVAHPGLIDMNQVKAQETRAMLDMMIGFTISPILWGHVASGLSAGRCQTPALRLVMEREEKIRNFQSTTSWGLSFMAHPSKASKAFQAYMVDELEDEESAVNYMENVHQTSHATVTSNRIKPWSESAPPPLMTSTLQQQASARFGMNPKQTMQHAQKLYEAGHITYMRTDKAVLSEEAVEQAQEVVRGKYGEAFVSQEKKQEQKQQEQKVEAQEAHEAIRPTHMECEEVDGDPYQKKLYRLIWQRAIQSVMSPAKGETCTLQLQIEDDEWTWQARAKHTTFEGWHRVGQVASLDEEEDNDQTDTWSTLSTLQEGTQVLWSSMTAQPKDTKAAGRYTEATLVRELEAKGIGRPSTFASLLSVIQEKGYVEVRDSPPKDVDVTEYTLEPSVWPPKKRACKKKVGAEKQRLAPTELGRSVWGFLETRFDDLFAYGFTAQMERRLDEIAQGTESPAAVLQSTWDSYQARYHEMIKKSKGGAHPKVREFSGGLKAVQSKKGPILLNDSTTPTRFYGWPKAERFDSITEETARAFVESQTSNEANASHASHASHGVNSSHGVNRVRNGQPIVKRTGKFGDYFQCGEVTIPFQEEPVEETIKRLEAKEAAKGPVREFKEYVIRTGPYGPYIMKTSLKKAKFVSLPKGIDVSALGEKDVEALYRLGLESKKYKPKDTKPKEPNPNTK